MAHTKESIVNAAIDLLNRDGIEGLSMRTLATELGVKAAALYWHFSGKRELYGAIAEHMCVSRFSFLVGTGKGGARKFAGDPEIGEGKGESIAFLKSTIRAFRRMLLTVRDSTEIFENSAPFTPCRMSIIRIISDRLLALGVQSDDLMTISNMLNNYTLSFVADEVRFANTSAEELGAMEGLLGEGDANMFLSPRNFDDQFETGLKVLFGGIIAQIEMGNRRSGEYGEGKSGGDSET